MKRSVCIIAFALSLTVCVSGCGVDDNGGNDLSGLDLSGIDISYGDVVQDGSGPSPDNPFSSETFVPVGSEYPSAELLLKITGPSGGGYAVSSGSLVSVTGVVFSQPNSNTQITWRAAHITANGPVHSADGVANGAPFWQTDAVPLNPGDNLITVTANNETGEVTESLLITYNPGFMYQSTLKVNPPAIFVEDKQQVFATISLGLFGDVINDALTLQQVDKDGKKIKDLGSMQDDGQVGASGDEIEKDGVFTLQLNISCPSADPIFLRTVAQVTGASAYSSVVRIDCVNRLTVQTCASHQNTMADARAAYNAALSAGVAQARQSAIDVLTADALMQEVVTNAEHGGLWVMWNDGVLGALNLPVDGNRGPGGGGDEAPIGSIESALVNDIPILSKNTMLLSPYNSEFGGEDETQFIGSIAGKMLCPAYELKGPYNGAAANLSRFRSMNINGIIAIATHGEVYFKGMSAAAKERKSWSHKGAQEVLWTGEALDCGKLTQATTTCTSTSQCPAGTTCLVTQAVYSRGGAAVSGICYDATQVDLMTGRVVLSDKTYGVLPSFVLDYGAAQGYPESLVHLGACRTLYNGSLASSFFAAGVKAVTGFSNYVSSQFANQMGSQFFARMVEQKMKAGEAYGVGAEDPANQGSFFRMFGARNLDVSQSDILNPSFETGDLTAWYQDGDGRVIAKLGTAGPVSGKFMAVISTGLGFTVETGNIEQTFCIPKGIEVFSFFWKYYSEEFHEWCGSQFQDTFKADMVATGGVEHSVVDLSVDDLCAPSDCFIGCGSKYVGLVSSDVQFDQGDNHKTEWQQATYNVSNLAGGGPVTLRFFCTDKGDSIYDTAVLVDHIKFQEQL